ncbi:hypothetical protein DVH24_013153 [Malus domestica]|uniref:Uncharacterized protein n=1 Tax=Malus domestica TaxID=3750 RepID=A0A498IK19_MALDO|nr:hypothetical protein DVH24_013153 [Malus domestica]
MARGPTFSEPISIFIQRSLDRVVVRYQLLASLVLLVQIPVIEIAGVTSERVCYYIPYGALGEDCDDARGEFLGRKWNLQDLVIASTLSSMHFHSLLAPCYFAWGAFWVAFALHMLTSLGVTLSFHRNLSHKIFRLPKWLEYLFAYVAVLSLQGSPIEWYGGVKNVQDLKRQAFYRFLHHTYVIHSVVLPGSLLYAFGGLPFLVWGLVRLLIASS